MYTSHKLCSKSFTVNMPAINVSYFELTFEFNNLEVGETVSIKFLIDRAKVVNSEELRIDSSVSIVGQEDSTTRNNNKSSILFIQQSPKTSQ